MNTFEYSFYIDDTIYNIYIDSSKDEWKRIVINNCELVYEKYTLALNRKAYIIYYPIDLNGNELVISIDDNPIMHQYNIYLDNISLIDGTCLDEQYNEASDMLTNGFITFSKNNWLDILKENLLSLLGSLIVTSAIFGYALQEFGIKFFFIFLLMPFSLPLFILGEWFHYKNTVTKYKNCFRPKVFYKS